MGRVGFAILLAVLELFAIPINAFANGGHGSFTSVNVAVNHANPYGYYYGGYYGRPLCPVGIVNPGCVGPVRKSVRFAGRVAFRAGRAVGIAAFRTARFAGRVAFRTARFTGRVVVGAGRVAGRAVVRTGRFLFGRRWHH